MHKFHSLPPISGIGFFAMALAARMPFADVPARASGGQVKLADSKGHSATRNVQRADGRLAAGG